jgi:hypothetical protein
MDRLIIRSPAFAFKNLPLYKLELSFSIAVFCKGKAIKFPRPLPECVFIAHLN